MILEDRINIKVIMQKCQLIKYISNYVGVIYYLH